MEIGGTYGGTEDSKQKDSQDAYMEKLQDIEIRVPKEYYDKIKSCAESKGLSINKLVISLLEKEIDKKILSIRKKQNRKGFTRIGVMLYAEIKGILRYISNQLSFTGRCAGTHEGYIGTMERFCQWKI